MIYSKDYDCYVTETDFTFHKGDSHTGIPDEIEGCGDMFYIPDYYDEFPRRFIRRFGLTETFKKLFVDIKEVDSYEAFELLNK